MARGEGDHGGLSGAGLGLGYNVPALNYGPDGPLLDGGGLLIAVVVDASEKLILEVHLIEARDRLYIIGRHKLQPLLQQLAASQTRLVHRNHARSRGCYCCHD